jgi:CheY-like chemotaxis protein
MNAPEERSVTPPKRSLRIAFADDVPDIRDLARLWLEAAGHSVEVRGDGKDALRLIEQEPFDLLITDIMMPERDGFELIRMAKQARPNLRIVAVSGGASVMSVSDSLRVAKALGASAVVAKPFNRTQLFAAIAEAMA